MITSIDFNEELWVFLKFCSKEEYAHDILNGNFFANTVEFFRNLEKDTGTKGQGDGQETILSVPVQNIRLKDSKGNILLESNKADYRVEYEYDKVRPIVCFTGIKYSDMILTSETENKITLEFPFTEDEYLEMKETFGEYCVLFDPIELFEKFHKYSLEQGVEASFDSVKYIDGNTREKFSAYDINENTPSRYYFKDLFFKNQREVRFVLNKEIPEDNFLRVGKFKKAVMIPVEQLKNLGIEMNIKEAGPQSD